MHFAWVCGRNVGLESLGWQDGRWRARVSSLVATVPPAADGRVRAMGHSPRKMRAMRHSPHAIAARPCATASQDAPQAPVIAYVTERVMADGDGRTLRPASGLVDHPEFKTYRDAVDLTAL